MLIHLKDAYDNYRVKFKKLSFEDMIDNFYFKANDPEDVDALIIDEAQDCNKPQIKALHKMATNVKTTIIILLEMRIKLYLNILDQIQTIFINFQRCRRIRRGFKMW